MLRLNYRVDSQIKTKIFNNVKEGYWFAIHEIATIKDREYYEECCGYTFENAVADTDYPNELMMCIMKNAIENIVLVCIE